MPDQGRLLLSRVFWRGSARLDFAALSHSACAFMLPSLAYRELNTKQIVPRRLTIQGASYYSVR